jgi:hypothetical protein
MRHNSEQLPDRHFYDKNSTNLHLIPLQDKLQQQTQFGLAANPAKTLTPPLTRRCLNDLSCNECSVIPMGSFSKALMLEESTNQFNSTGQRNSLPKNNRPTSDYPALNTRAEKSHQHFESQVNNKPMPNSNALPVDNRHHSDISFISPRISDAPILSQKYAHPSFNVRHILHAITRPQRLSCCCGHHDTQHGFPCQSFMTDRLSFKLPISGQWYQEAKHAHIFHQDQLPVISLRTFAHPVSRPLTGNTTRDHSAENYNGLKFAHRGHWSK